MKRGVWKTTGIIFLAAGLVSLVAGCSFGPGGTSTSVPGTSGATGKGKGVVPASVTHTLVPVEPPASASTIKDSTSAALAAQHRVNSGENYAFNLFERPFSQDMQTYAPYLDIVQADYSKDDTWAYISIRMVGQDQKNGGLPGTYAAELDVNQDGRGDFLVVVTAPKSTSWSSDGVKVYADNNHDVGGITPVQSDPPPQGGDGYERLLVDSGQGKDPDLAFARISPSNPNTVQLAFKWSMTNSPSFMWGVWAFDPSMFHPDWFDYNDHFTQAQAGSPVIELSQYYPLKGLYLLDNTCRWGSGFTPSPNVPGSCPQGAAISPGSSGGSASGSTGAPGAGPIQSVSNGNQPVLSVATPTLIFGNLKP